MKRQRAGAGAGAGTGTDWTKASSQKDEKLNKLKSSIKQILVSKEDIRRSRSDFLSHLSQCEESISNKSPQINDKPPSDIDEIHQQAMFSAVALAPSPLPIAESHSDSLPLYKRVKVGDSVLARYSDGRYYEATVHAVVHGGYPSAQYEVRFSNYSDIHLVSWKDLQLSRDEDERDIIAKRSRTLGSSTDDTKDAFGRDRRPAAIAAPPPATAVSEPAIAGQSSDSADINPSLLNRPKGAWRKK
jgi:hypothetical protein